jgi:DNA polymerase III epsilon subunit-like protein
MSRPAFASLDFETSDRHAASARVVQIGVAIFDDEATPSSGPTATMSLAVAGGPVAPGALRIHGRDGKTGFPAPLTLPYLVELLLRLDVPIVTYNGWEFDYQILAAECNRLADDAPPRPASTRATAYLTCERLSALPPFLDVYPLVKSFDPPVGKANLPAACYAAGVLGPHPAHDAVADASATGRLLLALLRSHADEGWTLAALADAQAPWREAWRRAHNLP